MAVKGKIAKENIINKIAMAFGTNWIGEVGGKYYIWADDGGERVQIALTLTCPKVQVEAPDGASAMDHSDWDFDDAPAAVTPQASVKAEVTEEEKARIAEMMNRLGL